MTTKQTLEWWCRKYPKSAPHMRAQAEKERIAAVREVAAARQVVRQANTDRLNAKRDAWRECLGRAAPAVLAVADVYETDPTELLMSTHRGTLEAHCVLGYLLHIHTPHMNAVDIGKLLHRNHSTVRQWIIRAGKEYQWGVKTCLEMMNEVSR